ncbi:MAG TPA: hypothetical protein VGA56_13295, partial [Opitutaceae bacterium]
KCTSKQSSYQQHPSINSRDSGAEATKEDEFTALSRGLREHLGCENGIQSVTVQEEPGFLINYRAHAQTQ